MRLQITTTLALVLSLACLMGCQKSELPGEIIVDTEKLQKINGKIQIEVADGRNSKLYTLSASGASTSLEKINPVRNTFAVGVDLQGGKDYVPPHPARTSVGPYALDKTERYVAAVFADKQDKHSTPNNLVIFDRESKKEFVLDKQDKSSIDALAWSPDSQQLAILRMTTRHRFTFWTLAGHGDYWLTYELQIVDKSGVQLVNIPLLKDAPNGWGKIEWLRM